MSVYMGGICTLYPKLIQGNVVKFHPLNVSGCGILGYACPAILRSTESHTPISLSFSINPFWLFSYPFKTAFAMPIFDE